MTVWQIANAPFEDEEISEEETRAVAADLMAQDRGVQVKHRRHGIRLEMKPEFADLIGRMIPVKGPKPISNQALETLAIVALKQPVSIGDVNAIRAFESAGTMQILPHRKRIARAAHLGPNREKLWRTTPLLLETFSRASLDELYQEGRKEQIFAPAFGGEFGDNDGGSEYANERQEDLSEQAARER